MAEIVEPITKGGYAPDSYSGDGSSEMWSTRPTIAV